ncbi:MAG: AAA family ATPase, partial [Mycoplasma sp.]
MIKKITSENNYCFKNGGIELSNLEKYNFIFGRNGSGKSTISKLLINNRESDTVEWTGEKCGIHVFNSEFIESNMQEDLRGIYTISKNNINIKSSINEKENEKEKLILENNRIEEEILNQKKEINQKKESSKNELWLRYKKLCEEIKYAHNQQSKDKVFTEMENIGESKNMTIEKTSLIKRWEILSSANIVEKEKIVLFNFNNLLKIEYETKKLLTESYVGSENLEIAQKIKGLNSEQWTFQGIEFLKKTENKCPFCDSQINEILINELNQLFDKTYKIANENIINYENVLNEINIKFSNYIETLKNTKQLDDAAHKNSLLITESINCMISYLKSKKTDLTTSIKCDFSLDELISNFQENICSINEEINKYNNIILNKKNEKLSFLKDLWIILYNENIDFLKEHFSSIERIENLIKDNAEKNDTNLLSLENCNKLIEDLNRNYSDIKETCDEINKILKAENFYSFNLKINEKNEGFKIVRENGELANKSLSEGERSFLMFLYFYVMICSAKEELIVFIDDPINSNDNYVMTVVAEMIKKMYQLKHVKQMFVTSHNLFFFGRIINSKMLRDRNSNNSEPNKEINSTFWKIQKNESVSKILNISKGQFKTHYEELWHQVFNENNAKFVENSARRI